MNCEFRSNIIWSSLFTFFNLSTRKKIILSNSKHLFCLLNRSLEVDTFDFITTRILKDKIDGINTILTPCQWAIVNPTEKNPSSMSFKKISYVRVLNHFLRIDRYRVVNWTWIFQKGSLEIVRTRFLHLFRVTLWFACQS